MKTLISLFMLLLVVTTAQAHKASDSYLNIQVNEAQITGQWDIALRDLDHAIGLDTNADGAITWIELRTRHSEIAAYALARLHLTADGRGCTTVAEEQLVDQHSDGAYSVLRFSARCPVVVQQLVIDYRLFFDLDPQHRGLLQLSTQGSSESAIFAPTASARSFTLAIPDGWRQFADYYRSGVGHIWTGFDHLLFLLALLLPSVLRRSAGRWIAVTQWRSATTETVKIVTAFTVAHSLTLGLATFEVVNLPSRWVESAIAASVILAALNNLYPLLPERRWLAALAFGLLHGFGFATVLTEMGLAPSSLALSLVAFNLGVESGQLVVVAAFLPLALRLRHTLFYRRTVVAFGSLVVAAVALVWLLERSLDLRLLQV